MNYDDYWSPGQKIFVSVTSSRARAIDSITSLQCQIVTSWDKAFESIDKFLQANRFSLDKVEIYTKPRLCRKCMQHATQPLIFDITEYPQECLCTLIGTPCGIHKPKQHSQRRPHKPTV